MTGSCFCHQFFDDAARLRLICLPYAGGGTAIYHRWRPGVPKSVDVVPACLPGREGRLHEPPLSDLRAAACALATDLQYRLDRPWALLGHSMGALIGFELARELRRRGRRLPSLLIVAASRAPHLVGSEPSLHTLPDNEFVAAVDERFGGIPPAVLENAELLDALLPMLRSDMKMVETYEYIEAPPLETDILALGGMDDSTVTAAQLGEWRRHTSGKFSSRLLPGGHFFLFEGHRNPAGAAKLSRSPAEQLSLAMQVIVSRLEQLAGENANNSSEVDDRCDGT